MRSMLTIVALIQRLGDLERVSRELIERFLKRILEPPKSHLLLFSKMMADMIEQLLLKGLYLPWLSMLQVDIKFSLADN